ncbi:MAG: hypothetical protein M3Y56_07940 [Armatimonadota bacterium]|nr:hypothetical protein [Armatimonadota bacterium]
MFGKRVGTAKISEAPAHTRNLFGALKEVAGRSLPVLERSERGDCLCVVDGSYLIDVDSQDVEEFTAVEPFKVSST